MRGAHAAGHNDTLCMCARARDHVKDHLDHINSSLRKIIFSYNLLLLLFYCNIISIIGRNLNYSQYHQAIFDEW